MITKKDYLIAAINGMLTGAFALAVLFFLSISFPFKIPVMILGVPILWVFGVWLGGFLGRLVAPFFNQFGKFAAVGFSSASVDFAILNFISGLTGVTAGITVGWINMPGFLVAVVNGYLWNRLWVFGGPAAPSSKSDFGSAKKPDFFPGAAGLFSDFPKFFAVTVLGLLINSGIIIFLTTYSPSFGFAPYLWLNIAKVAANAVAMIWNFAGYKFFAFKTI